MKSRFVIVGVVLAVLGLALGGAVFAGAQGLEEVTIGGEDEITKGKEVVELSEGQVIPVKRAEGFPLKGEKEANEPGPVRVTEIHTMLEKASVNLGEVTIEGSISPNGELPVAKEQLEGTIPPITEAEKGEAINIAKADPRVQELLDKGAEIGMVIGRFSGRMVESEDGKTITLTSVTRDKVMVILELPGEELLTIVEVDLAEGEVVSITPEP